MSTSQFWLKRSSKTGVHLNIAVATEEETETLGPLWQQIDNKTRYPDQSPDRQGDKEPPFFEGTESLQYKHQVWINTPCYLLVKHAVFSFHVTRYAEDDRLEH